MTVLCQNSINRDPGEHRSLLPSSLFLHTATRDTGSHQCAVSWTNFYTAYLQNMVLSSVLMYFVWKLGSRKLALVTSESRCYLFQRFVARQRAHYPRRARFTSLKYTSHLRCMAVWNIFGASPSAVQILESMVPLLYKWEPQAGPKTSFGLLPYLWIFVRCYRDAVAARPILCSESGTRDVEAGSFVCFVEATETGRRPVSLFSLDAWSSVEVGYLH